MEVKGVLSLIGNKFGEGTQFLIQKISSLGINFSTTSAKIFNLLILAILIYSFIKIMEKPIKWLIILLLIILMVSTVVSWI